MVCWCNSSSPRWPCSLTGSKTWATLRRMAPACAMRESRSVREMAAGWAMTWIAWLGEVPDSMPGGSAEGARKRASGRSSSAPTKSISTGPPWVSILNALRLDAAEPARSATFAPSRLCAFNGSITTGSSASAASKEDPSTAEKINWMRGAGLDSSRTVRTSFASNVSPPTRATRGRSTAFSGELSNRVLRSSGTSFAGVRFRIPRAWPQPPPNRAAHANHDSAQNVRRREEQQHGPRVEENHPDQDPQHEEGEGRTRLGEIQILEAGITPRAHHQKRQQA